MRFSDNDISKVGLMDFSPRSRSRHTLYLVAAYLCTVLAVIVAATQGDSETARHTGMVIVSILIIALGLVSIYLRQRNNDLLLATEFQNMVYAAAAETGAMFCIITKRNGTVVHASRSLAQTFSYFPYPMTQALDGFYIESRLPKFDQAKVTEALEQDEAKSLLVKIASASGPMDIVLTIEPLSRPPGYYVIRGRAFSEKRGDQEKLASISSQQFQLLLDSSPTGHFLCDEHGTLRYVNPAFAALCGARPDSMVQERISITKLFTMEPGRSWTEDYEFKPLLNQSVFIQGTSGKASLSLHIHRQSKETSLLGTVTPL